MLAQRIVIKLRQPQSFHPTIETGIVAAMPRKFAANVATFPGGAAVSPRNERELFRSRAASTPENAPRIRSAADLDVPWICEILTAQAEARAVGGTRLNTPHPQEHSRRNKFVQSAVESEKTLVWRTQRAFLMATMTAPDVAFVEHLGGMPDQIISSDMAALLGKLSEQATIHLTIPHRDTWLGTVASRLDGEITETLWARDLPPQRILASAEEWPPAKDDVPLSLASASYEAVVSSTLESASVLYAPGGPVLTISTDIPVTDIVAIEDLAARFGAVSSVVRQPGTSNSKTTEADMVNSGHCKHTDTYRIPRVDESDDSEVHDENESASSSADSDSADESNETRHAADTEDTPDSAPERVIDLRDGVPAS